MKRLTENNINKTIKLIKEKISDFVTEDDDIKNVAMNIILMSQAFSNSVEDYIEDLRNKKELFGHY